MKRLLTILTLVSVLLVHLPVPVSAAQISDPRVWVRAKIAYESKDGVKDLSDDMITLSSEKWKKRGEFYYYGDPVNQGETLELMKSVHIPADWDNSYSGKRFDIIMTVQCAECLPEDAEWTENREVAYTNEFASSIINESHKGMSVQKGSIRVTLEEFESDGNTEKSYRNDKVIVPGEDVSKIVRITVNGEKSRLSAVSLPQMVKTGDEAHIVLYAVLASVSLVLAVIVGRRARG